ncbi:hypothetical protein KX816_03640 [Sphingosinicellaceae bacterium]|nr:hypothetical protein KX816_03640 [Sphingosinicellaceae bacterium]
MIPAPLAAIAVSAILIISLCRSDPKRRRAAGNRIAARGTPLRWLLAALICLPGAYFIAVGDAAGFLIWLGGCGLIGWLIVLAFGALSSGRRAAFTTPPVHPR